MRSRVIPDCVYLFHNCQAYEGILKQKWNKFQTHFVLPSVTSGPRAPLSPLTLRRGPLRQPKYLRGKINFLQIPAYYVQLSNPATSNPRPSRRFCAAQFRFSL